MRPSTISTENTLIDRIAPALRSSFTPLPPLGVPLTEEQKAALYGGDVEGVVRDLISLAEDVMRNKEAS